MYKYKKGWSLITIVTVVDQLEGKQCKKKVQANKLIAQMCELK